MPGTVREVAKELVSAIPGGMETALLLREAFAPLPDSFHPGRAFHSWLDQWKELSPAADASRESPVLLFCYLPHWLNIALAMAVALMARKCRVDFVYLPYARHERSDSSSEVQRARADYWKFMRSNSPHLRFFNLGEVEPSTLSPEKVGIAETQALLDAKYILKREEINIEKNQNHAAVFQFRLKRNLDCMARLGSFLQRNRYDVILVPNGGSMEFGVAFRMAQMTRHKVVSFEFDSDGIVLSANRSCTEMDTSEEWLAQEPHRLTPEAENRVRMRMLLRQSAQGKSIYQSTQKFPRETARDKLLSTLGIVPDGRPVVLMCPNTAWDSALLGYDPVFPSLVEWVRQTVTYFSQRKDCWLIVRAHTLENLFGTGQPILSVIREHQPSLPDHIRLVGPDDPVNTYDLMDLCRLGLVYKSTTGLEIALRGTPVITAGQPHYSGKGFTTDVKTAAEYFGAIDRFLSKPHDHRLTPRQVELAWCCADVYFHLWPKPFPWHLATFWEDMDRWPMSKVLSEEGQALFGASFDLLANRIPSSKTPLIPSETLAIHGGKPVRETLLPYGHHWIDEEDIRSVIEVLRSDFITTGPKAAEFEEAFAAKVGARYAVSFSSGTAALHGAVFAAGLGPADEAVTTPLTFCATANSILYQGAKPIFADVRPDTLNLDPQEAARHIGPHTKALVIVDYAGHPADLDPLRETADRHGLVLIEDACHALGASYRNRRVGGISDMTIFSFHPVKHMTTGEGGMVTTNNPKVVGPLQMFRNHGIDSDARQRQTEGQWAYEMVSLGYNYHLTDISCGLGLAQLRKLDSNLSRRRQIADRYTAVFSSIPEIQPPTVLPEIEPAWHLYVIRLKLDRLRVSRSEILKALRAENIGVNVHYIPVPWHPYYQRLGYPKGQWPVAENASGQILSLPIFPAMSDRDAEDVIAAVRKVICRFRV